MRAQRHRAGVLRRLSEATGLKMQSQEGEKFHEPDTPQSRHAFARPWIVIEAADAMERFLKPHHRVFEWGSGGSTTWFSGRVAEVITVEHQRAWAEALIALGLPNVTVIEAPDDYPEFRAYANCIEQVGGMFDVILIDGADGYDLGLKGSRPACARLAVAHVAQGGMVVLDNSGSASNIEAAKILQAHLPTRLAYVGHALEPPGHHRDDVTETSIFTRSAATRLP